MRQPKVNLIQSGHMTQASLIRSLKQAFTESLRDNRDAVRDMLAEVIEDVVLSNAIREGEKSKPVKRQAVLKVLMGRK